MRKRATQIVVIGTSAGGIDALRTMAAALPADFPAPICIVMHVSPQSPGVLPEILQRAGALPAVSPTSSTSLQPGRLYVAAPDTHLVVEPGRVLVTRGPRENRFRPAIDPLFRSAAQVYGPATIGVILTGNLDDGVAGLGTIKQLGGTAIVQSPDEALFSSMPRHAVERAAVDYVVPLADIVPLLVQLTSGPSFQAEEIAVPDDVNIEVNIAKEAHPLDAGLAQVAEPSAFACPECHGVLLRMKRAGVARFRCHTGHAYSIESLLSAVDDGVEESLWNAVRALEEGELLMREMATHLAESHGADAKRLAARAEAARSNANAVRRVLGNREAAIP
jgi:two-component system, chemotaxis family, protein-glutamate methylesterase/glutaminase